MSLQSDLVAAREAIEAELIAKRKAIIVDVGTAIIETTPVRTGALRGSWQTTVGAPSPDATPRIDPNGEAPRLELEGILVTLEDDVFMTNNLGYAERIEMGYSDKAPAGMVRINIVGHSDISFTVGD